MICKLCGKEFKQISSDHLTYKHNISYQEYKDLYGIENAIGPKVSELKKLMYSSRKGNDIHKYIETDNTLYLYLESGGEEVVVLLDIEDKEKMYNHPNKWIAVRDKKNRNRYQVRSKLSGSRNYREVINIGRFIMDVPKGLQVDHINGDTLDNRRENLRIVTQSENKQNTHGAYKNSQSGVRGVWWNKNTNLWVASVKVNKEIVWEQQFSTLEAAEQAIRLARKKYMPFSSENRECIEYEYVEAA